MDNQAVREQKHTRIHGNMDHLRMMINNLESLTEEIVGSNSTGQEKTPSSVAPSNPSLGQFLDMAPGLIEAQSERIAEATNRLRDCLL